MDIEQLNFHHLRYFWAVAKDGNLTRTAARLHVAQSALSSQILQLEAQLGEKLFTRDGRRLVLTEAGALALAFAEDVFAAGGEMITTLTSGRRHEHVLSIGSVATLSRNFQESVIKPLLTERNVRLRLESGSLADLLLRLEQHTLDLVLANTPPARELQDRLRCRRLARQPVSIVGARAAANFRFPHDLTGRPMIVPGRESDIRWQFDALCEQAGVTIHILAEVDDMATMRLLARDADVLAVLPSVVVRDELRMGVLHHHCVVPDLFESFYAITAERKFQHPLLATVLARDEHALLEVEV